MIPAAQASYVEQPPLWRRGGILVLVVLVHALLLVMLLRLAPPSGRPGGQRGATTITLLPDAGEEREASRETRQEQREEARPAPERAAEQPVLDQPVVPLPPTPAETIWQQVIPLGRSAMAASDVARMPARGRGTEQADAGGAAAPAGEGGGPTGPNGETLYAAEWYRKPTDAELAAYLPATRPRSGWGEVACQTVKDYRVEDCVEIGQSPPGSGLSRAVRQAAWQFRVLPPRVGGRPMVGAWVRIRITYGTIGAD